MVHQTNRLVHCSILSNPLLLARGFLGEHTHPQSGLFLYQSPMHILYWVLHHGTLVQSFILVSRHGDWDNPRAHAFDGLLQALGVGGIVIRHNGADSIRNRQKQHWGWWYYDMVFPIQGLQHGALVQPCILVSRHGDWDNPHAHLSWSIWVHCCRDSDSGSGDQSLSLSWGFGEYCAVPPVEFMRLGYPSISPGAGDMGFGYNHGNCRFRWRALS